MHTLLVYLLSSFRCCVAGMAYPTGSIPQGMIPLAKTSVSTVNAVLALITVQ